MKVITINGNMETEDTPTYVGPGGTKEWRDDGLLHRYNGPAVEYSEGGGYEWHREGDLHRLDGSTLHWTGESCKWVVQGGFRRLDGPYMIRANGEVEWTTLG